jgi:Leucine Rich repeat
MARAVGRERLGMARLLPSRFGITPAIATCIVICATHLWADEPSSFAAQLSTLAAKCDELGLTREAQLTRDWVIPRSPGRQYLFVPSETDPTAPRSSAGDLAKKWHENFRKLRATEAERLFAAAREVVSAGEAARAYRLLHEALRENPEHAAALAILQDSAMSQRRWVVQQPKLPHAQMGWLAGKHWRLETPHFVIATDHSPREAQELGRQLENLHALWRQLYFRYWSSGEALRARFAGRDEPLARPRPKMNVILVKDRAEYIAHLSATVPQIDKTVGIYLNKRHASFFYAGDTSVYPTWYHEATHQLFQEAGPSAIDEPGERQNFWAIEAAALYMESLADHGGYWTVGGCEADRLQFARYRTLSGDSMPLTRLVTLSREEVQTSPDISKLYSHAAGLAHFLIDGLGGKHREAFIDLLAAVYRGDDKTESLAQATGASLDQLDQQYRAYLDVTDDDLAGIPRPERLRNFSLGHTAVTDKGLAALARCNQLEWLDLSLLPITDPGLKQLASATKLKQLFLEGTKVTDASLPQIGACKQLEELDLSNLAITDEGLAAIAILKQLKVLYLTGSPITDAGLAHLRGLKQLELLETTGTKITPEGRKKLELALPKLKSG